MNPVASFLIRLGLWSAAAFAAVNVLAATAISWAVHASLHEATVSARWTATGLAFFAIQLGSLPFWIPLTVATAADRTITSVGLARHVLDGAFRVLAIAWPKAETLRVGTTIPVEVLDQVRTSISTFADEQVVRLPRLARPVSRWSLNLFGRLLIRAMTNTPMAREHTDGSLQVLELPRVFGSAYDRVIRRQLWVLAVLIAAASLAAQAASVTGVLAWCRPSQTTAIPVETAAPE